jgi:hypothetical protein
MLLCRLAICLALVLPAAACDPGAFSPWGGYAQR